MAKILVVDDDPDFIEITRMVLEAKKYDVATASDGSQALSMMKQEKPNLVLLDIMMAQPLDGLNVSQKMMEDDDLKNIPVIVVSSITDSEHADEFPTDQYLPLDDWLAKPVQPDVLLNKVELYLSRYQK